MPNEQSYNLKYTGTEIDALLDKTNAMNASAVVPTGGTTNQVLAKRSNANYDLKWVDQTGGGMSIDVAKEYESTTTVATTPSRMSFKSYLNAGDEVHVFLQRESGEWTHNSYMYLGETSTETIQVNPNNNTGVPIYARFILTSGYAQIGDTSMSNVWYSGFDYTGTLSQNLVTSIKIYVKRYTS